MTDAYSVGQLLGNRIAQTPPPGDASNRVITSNFIAQGGLNISPPAGTTQGFNITQNVTGTPTLTGNLALNGITVTDSANAGGNFGIGFFVNYNYGGASAQGGREAIQGTVSLVSATSTSNTNRNYVGVQGVGESIVNDNGTGTTIAASAGAVFGGGFIGALFTGATNFLNVTGAEFNSFVEAGASAAIKTLIQGSADTRDAVQGHVVDSMIWLSNQSTSNPGWTNGILFDGANGVWPISSTGTIIQTLGVGTAAKGIDFTATSFTGNAFASNAFSVDSAGNLLCFQLGVSGTVFRTQTPATLTGTTGALTSASQIINASGTFTLTLPTPNLTGQWLWIRSIAAQIVNSASSNVVPLAGGAAQSTILTATAGANGMRTLIGACSRSHR